MTLKRSEQDDIEGALVERDARVVADERKRLAAVLRELRNERKAGCPDKHKPDDAPVCKHCFDYISALDDAYERMGLSDAD